MTLSIPSDPNYFSDPNTGSIRRKDYLATGGRKAAQAAHKARKRIRAKKAKIGQVR